MGAPDWPRRHPRAIIYTFASYHHHQHGRRVVESRPPAAQDSDEAEVGAPARDGWAEHGALGRAAARGERHAHGR